MLDSIWVLEDFFFIHRIQFFIFTVSYSCEEACDGWFAYIVRFSYTWLTMDLSYSFDLLFLQCGSGRSVAPIKAGFVARVGRRNAGTWSGLLSLFRFQVQDSRLIGPWSLEFFVCLLINPLLCVEVDTNIFVWEFGCGDEFFYYLIISCQLFLLPNCFLEFWG